MHKKLTTLAGGLIFFGILLLSDTSLTLSHFPDLRFELFAVTARPPEGSVVVRSVVDGDTIIVRLDDTDETIRLIGIDTPETKDPRKGVQCFGYAASTYTRDLLRYRFVRLESDESQGDRDVFGRLLRTVILEDGTSLNERLVSDGYAFAYEKYPSKSLSYFLRLEERAKEKKLGLWGACSVTIKNNGASKSTQFVAE